MGQASHQVKALSSQAPQGYTKSGKRTWHFLNLEPRLSMLHWWYTYPSEKWWSESQLGLWMIMIFPSEWKVIQNSMVPVTTNQLYAISIPSISTIYVPSYYHMRNPWILPYYHVSTGAIYIYIYQTIGEACCPEKTRLLGLGTWKKSGKTVREISYRKSTAASKTSIKLPSNPLKSSWSPWKSIQHPLKIHQKNIEIQKHH